MAWLGDSGEEGASPANQLADVAWRYGDGLSMLWVLLLSKMCNVLRSTAGRSRSVKLF